MGSIKPNQTTQAFIDSIKDDAQVIAQDHDLYASVMIAQAVLESGSGSSGLSANYNNLFGIKGTYQGMSVSLPTKEDDGTGNSYTITATFRAYPTARDSLLDYAELVGSKLYAPAHKSNCTSYVDACNYLQGRYATSTTYSAQLQDLINAYNLTQYDNPVAVTDAAQDAAVADAAASPFHTASGLFDENGLVPLSAMLPLDGTAAAAIAGADADAQQAAPVPQVIVGMLVAAAAAVALAVQTAWDGTYTEPQKDADGTYLIGSPDELMWFGKNAKMTDSARLTADICINEDVTADTASLYNWTPIGWSKPYLAR